jgi:hypothetical protein
MLAKKTSKNQITLPKTIVKIFPDVDYFDVRIHESQILLTPVRMTPLGSPLEIVRQKMKRLGMTEKDVGEAIRWARGRKK